jgi:ubiquinone/menaquinone biosynthesis C-methylase UbiE
VTKLTAARNERIVQDWTAKQGQGGTMNGQPFTPALGRFGSTALYDPVVALTRERLWRALAAMHVAPRPDDMIADVGCGTGSLALMLNRTEPKARIVGIDPDPDVLDVARAKAAAANASVEWQLGMGDALAQTLAVDSVDTVVSSLVLHQCPLAMKRAVLASVHEVLRPGGKVVIADYGRQRTALMRLAFRIVQFADGKQDTQPNADGVVPELMALAGFIDIREPEVVQTATGSLSVYVARKP